MIPIKTSIIDLKLLLSQWRIQSTILMEGEG